MSVRKTSEAQLKAKLTRRQERIAVALGPSPTATTGTAAQRVATEVVPSVPQPGHEELVAKAKEALLTKARYAMSSDANAAGVVMEYAKTPFGDLDLGSLTRDLKASMESVNGGDMKQCENMLMGQAIALQSIFVHMSRRVLNQPLARQFESNFAMAMKAQNQCRMTLETLNELKNPRQATFVRTGQTNIAHNQQINNRRPPRTRKNKGNGPNELLEQTHGKRLERRAAPATELSDPSMATVETIDGTQDTGGQSGIGRKRVQRRSSSGSPA